MRRGNYRRMYGVTIADYDALFTLQGGKCAICQSTDPGGGFQHFAVDHDHSTGRIRGLLCVACNRGLGLFRDDVATLGSAISYLESARKEEVR